MTTPSTYTVYSKNGCSYCEKVKAVLTLAEVRFIEVKLDRDFDRKQFISTFGAGSTFPQVLDEEGNQLGGASETVKYLKEQGLV